jgi:hypothetical protein
MTKEWGNDCCKEEDMFLTPTYNTIAKELVVVGMWKGLVFVFRHFISILLVVETYNPLFLAYFS